MSAWRAPGAKASSYSVPKLPNVTISSSTEDLSLLNSKVPSPEPIDPSMVLRRDLSTSVVVQALRRRYTHGQTLLPKLGAVVAASRIEDPRSDLLITDPSMMSLVGGVCANHAVETFRATETAKLVKRFMDFSGTTGDTRDLDDS